MISKRSANVRRPMPAPMHLILALLFTLALCCGANGQTTLYVDDDNCPSPGSGSVIDPYCAIQDAIVASADGDTVEVAPGTYFESIDFIGKAITLRSRDGAATTIIDATNVPIAGETVSVVRCINGETAATVLDGFTITGGSGDKVTIGIGSNGGGMLNKGSSPTVSNCIFSENITDFGGAMYNTASSPTLTNCMFTSNTGLKGGGLFNTNSSRPTMTNCTFSWNKAEYWGGGMYNIGSDPSLVNCRFTNNFARNSGGGVFNIFSNPTVQGCTFSDNIANNGIDGEGGGMYNEDSSPKIKNCTFSGNIGRTGGAMHNDAASSPMLANCTFTGNMALNSGGGMYNQDFSRPTITNCTFSNNAARVGGGMINVSSTPSLTNCIFDINTATSGDGGGMYNFTSSPVLSDCAFIGNTATNSQGGGGGGMSNFFSSNPILTNCMFDGNTAGFDFGGGMVNAMMSNPILRNCSFNNNSADNGGGMSNASSSPTIINCTFTNNTARGGGGMCNEGGSDSSITNCAFYGNTASFRGGGIYVLNSSSPMLTNCSFNGNSAPFGSSILIGGSYGTSITNCVVWGDGPDELNIGSSSATISYSNIKGSGGSAAWRLFGGIDVGGNIDVDPLFIDPIGSDGIAGTEDDDLRLSPGSPCVDAGNYDAYLAAGGGLIDLDGKDRAIDNTNVIDTGVGSVTYLDMGAYEQGPCHDDGIINLNDLETLEDCLVGPGGGVGLGCPCSDFNLDGHVDLRDYASYQLAFTGPPTLTAQYQLTFESTWSAATHPQDFPSGPHFSGLIGGTHNRNVKFWEVGQLSSVGIENMAEFGSKTALTNEVNAAISAGDAGSVISGSGISPSPGSVSVNFTATQAFGLVTITSMLAPSPDWFVGVDSLPLFNHNRWADEIVVVVEPFDAGTDSGVSYASANADTNPADPITQIVGFPFLDGATQAPLGTFTITRID